MPHYPSSLPSHITAALILADGTIFYGQGIGSKGTTIGEVCFNTGMTGYQETLTDPSYAGQIITFTFPHIGNVGSNDEDIECATPAVKGLIVRNPISSPSNYRSNKAFLQWLEDHNIIGLSGIDTRALVHHIRHNGAQNGLIIHFDANESPDLAALHKKVADYPSLKGMELANTVTRSNSSTWNQTSWTPTSGYGQYTPDANDTSSSFHVVAIDYGCKLNILRSLASHDCKVTVVPAATPAKDILALNPDGIFLSNGPGDPAATSQYSSPILQELIKSGVPIFGICLGHQLLALAMGCSTRKLPQGHRGNNHPVHNIQQDIVEITSQNHGFVVDDSHIPDDITITHRSLFDGTVEGLAHKDKPVFCVQYHPESSPGPHDSQYLFKQFVSNMTLYRKHHPLSNVKG